jgi:hypothetical protein
MTCQHTMTLGVYLLGALDPTERSAFESHLSYCEICRGELVRLAPLPGLLNQITPGDFADNMPSTGVEGGVVVVQTAPVRIPVQSPLPPLDVDEAPVTRPPNKPAGGPRNRTMSRRRFSRVLSAAAAVVVLAVGAVFGWQAIRHDETVPPQAEAVVWSGESADGTIGGEARLIDREWGTQFEMKLHGMPPGRGCYLVVYDHYGKRQTAGWWGTDHDPDDVIPGAAWIRRSKIDRLEFMLDDHKTVVLTIEAPR